MGKCIQEEKMPLELYNQPSRYTLSGNSENVRPLSQDGVFEVRYGHRLRWRYHPAEPARFAIGLCVMFSQMMLLITLDASAHLAKGFSKDAEYLAT